MYLRVLAELHRRPSAGFVLGCAECNPCGDAKHLAGNLMRRTRGVGPGITPQHAAS